MCVRVILGEGFIRDPMGIGMDCNLKKLEKSPKKTDYRLFFSGEITSSRDSESNLILDKGLTLANI